MSIRFYIHTPLPDVMHERRALFGLASALYRQVGAAAEPYTLIVNLDVNGLPQLDALLLAPGFAAICECKAYFDPIVGRHLTGKWVAERGKRRQPVRGGSERNPFLQIKRSRLTWQSELALELSGFVLFSPYLHPDSKLPKLGPAEKWCAICGIDEIGRLLVSTGSVGPPLDAETQNGIVARLGCDEWPIVPLLTRTLGYLHVIEKGRPLVRYPIRPFDSFTVGRSRRVEHMVPLHSPKISGTHARIYSAGDGLLIEDLGSKNGTYRGTQTLTGPHRLEPDADIRLGSPESDGVQIRFVPAAQSRMGEPTKPTF